MQKVSEGWLKYLVADFAIISFKNQRNTRPGALNLYSWQKKMTELKILATVDNFLLGPQFLLLQLLIKEIYQSEICFIS